MEQAVALECLGPARCAAENAVVAAVDILGEQAVFLPPAGIGRFCYYNVIVATSRHTARGRRRVRSESSSSGS